MHWLISFFSLMKTPRNDREKKEIKFLIAVTILPMGKIQLDRACTVRQCYALYLVYALRCTFSAHFRFMI